MARLFTAVDLSAPGRDAIVEGQHAIAAALRTGGDVSLRLVQPAHLHVTLVFIGEVAEERVASFCSIMSEDLPIEPFTVELDSPGVFPPRGAPRVLWYGVSAGADRLRTLHAAVASRVAMLGVLRDDRRFQPHLTIGRWKGERGRRPYGALPALPIRVRLRVDHATLFRSRLRSAGPEHVPLAVARLSGAP
ncbi:MAG: RNA 2',3'-cyclic phosphodiesterase, partial [Vicinamibacterales bacterium]